MRRSIPLLALLAALAAVVAMTLSGQTAATAQPSPAQPHAAAHPPTKQVYVRPVTVSGKPAPGWTVTRESGTVDCSGTSPGAVNPGITSCYPTAYGLRACWKSSGHTVLCVRDARERELVRIRYSGTYPDVEGPRTPTPIDLVLADGRTCLMRVGGAWGSPAQHPQWVGFDSCTRNASVYGPGRRDGIDRRSRTWAVSLWRTGVDPEGEHLVTRAVTAVYYVGTAADPS